jgi:hypothetical protein
MAKMYVGDSMHVGGSFAPPLTDDALERYRGLAAGLPKNSRIRSIMDDMLACCDKWWDLPESNGTGKPHATGLGTVVTLSADNAKALDSHIPWDDELETWKRVLDGIDAETNKELRDAAHHLLWHVCELSLGREPLTADKL